MNIVLDLSHSEGDEHGTVQKKTLCETRETPALRDACNEAPRTRRAMVSSPELIAIIEGEIIPRLFLAHSERTPHQLVAASLEAENTPDCRVLAGLLLHGDCAEVVRRVEALLTGGMRRDQLYLELLAPIPRTLSLLWSEGRCSFEEIATGLRCTDEVLAQLHDREHMVPDLN